MKKQTLFVSVYRIVDYYGGPEEGGWYYPVNELLDSIICYPGKHQQAKIRQAKKWLTEDWQGYKYLSITVEKKLGAGDTTKNPAPIYE
jgi:hypothetical protein